MNGIQDLRCKDCTFFASTYIGQYCMKTSLPIHGNEPACISINPIVRKTKNNKI